MKQGGKSIIGLWKFHPNAIYQKGDFVISGENIYRVNGDVQGINPDEDLGNGVYELYPGNRIDTKEEFEAIVNNSESTTDQYISSSALNSILKGVYFGLDSNGVINSSIDIAPNNTIATSSDISLSGSGDILDELLDAPGYNNGSIKVSKNLDSIKNIVGHPDENDIVSRGDKKWVVCDRTKCKKCWECVRVCENIRKTIQNELVINNGPSDDIGSISTQESNEFTKAVNICPYAALSFTNSEEDALSESSSYEDAVSGESIAPARDIIIFGAGTETRQEEVSTTGYDWVRTDTESSSEQLYGIALPTRFFSSQGGFNAINTIKDYINSRLLHYGLDDSVVWYATPFQALPVDKSSESRGTNARSSRVYPGKNWKKVRTVSEVYNTNTYDELTAVCIFKKNEGASSGVLSVLLRLLEDFKIDIQASYENDSGNFNWKSYISNGSYHGQPGDIIVTGTHQVTTETYYWLQVNKTETKTITYTAAPKVCAAIDCLELVAQIVGGSDYDYSRIVQSKRTSVASVQGSNEYDWSLAKTRRFPSQWTTTLYPDSGKRKLSQYPISAYWSYFKDAPNCGEQANFYSSPRQFGTKSIPDTAFYNLTGNIFCVKIPESALQYFDIRNLGSDEYSDIRDLISTNLGDAGFTSDEIDRFLNNISNGGFTNFITLNTFLSTVAKAHCDYVFNVTFGRYFNNSYIQGSSGFVSKVKDKIGNHEYYNKGNIEEGTVHPYVAERDHIITTLEEWESYAGNDPTSTHLGEYARPTDGPSLSLLPRMLYSEWAKLISSIDLESDELSGENNSNLLLVPRWMSEEPYTLVDMVHTYAYTIRRDPFWDMLNTREEAATISNIDNNIRYIDGYYDRNFFITTADSYAILKQYSYYGNSGDNILRVQELIDPNYGEMYIRSTNSRDWKPCVINDINVVRKLTRLYSTLDSFRQDRLSNIQTLTSDYGKSSLSTWVKDSGWELNESINDRHYYVRSNISSCVFILLVREPSGKLHNITIYTDRRGVDAVYSISPEITISVKYSSNLNKVFIICSYGVDLEDIYYGK